MRKIKFRGIDKDNDFVVGDLVRNFCFDDDTDITECAICFENDWVPVKKETVGQFTGFKDIKGVDIYEGDIVSALKIEYIGEVLKKASGEWSINGYIGLYTNKYVIIGNIHENKELLEVKMIKKLIDSKTHEENILMSIEELSELIQAITKYERLRIIGKYSKLAEARNHILEEFVDVKITLEVVKNMFEFENSDIKIEYDEKMKRNIDRIEK